MPNDIVIRPQEVVTCHGVGCDRDALVGIAVERLVTPDQVDSQHGRAYLCARHFWEQTDPEAHE